LEKLSKKYQGYYKWYQSGTIHGGRNKSTGVAAANGECEGDVGDFSKLASSNTKSTNADAESD
jgi:hypothetical protein